MTPIRIQRRRVKGWKMPPNTVYVGRPTKWGNSFKPYVNAIDKPDAVNKFKSTMSMMLKQDAVTELRGKNLACFCPLDAPCHADVLLKIANK